MKITETKLPGIIIIEPRVFEDERGFFFESFNQKSFAEGVGHNAAFVQDNHSWSKQDVLRGLHFQVAPRSQGKLVRVLTGEIFDVAVDVRKNSPTFGQWVGVLLSGENKKQLWIPAGFAHGFYTLSHSADVQYKVTDYWDASCERCIQWDDPTLAIEWPLKGKPIVSAKDQQGNAFLSLKD